MRSCITLGCLLFSICSKRISPGFKSDSNSCFIRQLALHRAGLKTINYGIPMCIEDELIRYFKKNNLRRSNKKILVAQHLSALCEKVSAETLWITIRSQHRNISIASVYQSLNWMVELGFADRTLKGRKHEYRIKGAAARSSHSQSN